MYGNLLLCFIASWYAEAVPGATIYVSLDVDPEGNASVVYWDDEDIYYSQRWVSGTLSFWLEEYVNSSWDENYVYHDNYCVDRNGRPHLIFFRPPTDNKTPERYIYYVTKDSLNQWDCTYLCNEFLYLEMIDLALDTMDYPHVIVHKFYHYWDGVSWKAETLDVTHPYVIPSIAVDFNDMVHLSISGFPGNAFAGYGYKDGGGWHFEYDYTYPVSSPMNIRTDDSGNPHVLFALSTDSSLFYGVKRDDLWTYEEVSSINPGFIELHHDTVHLLCRCADTVRHYWKEDAMWLYENVHQGIPEDFVVDDDGYVHCLVYENNQIKYVTNRPQTKVFEEKHHTIRHNMMSRIVRLPIEISLAEFGYPDEIKIFDITGNRIAGVKTTGHNGVIVWDGQDRKARSSNAGIYFIVATKNNIPQTVKLIAIE